MNAVTEQSRTKRVRFDTKVQGRIGRLKLVRTMYSYGIREKLALFLRKERILYQIDKRTTEHPLRPCSPILKSSKIMS